MNTETAILDISLKVDDHTIFTFFDKITEQVIIDTVKTIEEKLQENNLNPTKLQNVFEITIEMIQNMLNYSYDTVELNNKKESFGSFSISYYSDKDYYKLESLNKIYANMEDKISKKIDSLDGIDSKTLRKLQREKMRSKEDSHSDGAGLGLIMMARKAKDGLHYEFSKLDDKVKLFKLSLNI